MDQSRYPILLPLQERCIARLHNSVNHSSCKQRNLSRAKKQHVHGFPMHKSYSKQEQCNLFNRAEYTVPIKYVGFHNYNCNNEWKGVLLLHNALLYSSQKAVSGLMSFDSSSDQILLQITLYYKCTYCMYSLHPTKGITSRPKKKNVNSLLIDLYFLNIKFITVLSQLHFPWSNQSYE